MNIAIGQSTIELRDDAFTIKAPCFEHWDNDIEFNGECDDREMLKTFLSFLLFAAERFDKPSGDGDGNVFPDNVAQWASEHSSELEMAWLNVMHELGEM